MRIFDSHVHSSNSPDAESSVMLLCEQAVAAGLSGFCVTDHCELEEYESGQFAERISQSIFDVGKAAKVFQGRLTLHTGVEISGVHHRPELARQVAGRPFDMILLSVHNDEDGTDIFYHPFDRWTPQEIDRYLTYYFTSLLRSMQLGEFDVVAHLTYPIRYITGRHKIPVDLGRYSDLTDAILRLAAQEGKGLEINTSGLFGPLADTMPPAPYIRRFRELGGEFVTIGSDSHQIHTLGAGFDQARQILADAGFGSYTFYRERHPLLIQIEEKGVVNV